MTKITNSCDKSAIHLILGGARSGKSRFAEQRVQLLEQQTQAKVVYVATALALDAEMGQRIEHHQKQRPKHWQTLEATLHLSEALAQINQSNPNAIVLIDCLTLWLSNCLLAEGQWPLQKQKLLEYLKRTKQPVFLVSNEVGSGIVPLGEITRRFVDEAGRLHQDIAAIASQVSLVVAGIPLAIKQ
ncbi:MAG: bifunctional adenosylcobinamide kinase/adenosylcobinamide-phosphate guanylyltransferase [Venatoribacter sp.]